MAAPAEGAVLDFRPVMTALRRRVGLIALVAGGVAVLVGAWAAFWPRPHEARAVLAAVGSSRVGLSLPGGDGGLLGGSIRLGSGGVEATPEMVSYLLTSESVLLTVAARTLPDGESLGEVLAGGPPAELGAARTLRRVRRHVRVTTARPTGLITLTVRHRDSSVARLLATGVVEEAQRLFAEVASSQAGQFRRAQDARVDSAATRLAAAEERLLRFNEGNRVVVEGTRLALERGRLERDVLTAQSVYQSAVSDRESARGRELEVTPALAVVEAMPARLPTEDRRVLALAAFAGLLAGAGLAMAIFLRELLRAPLPTRP